MILVRKVEIWTTFDGTSDTYTAVTGDYKPGSNDPMGVDLTEAKAVYKLFIEMEEREAEEADRTLATILKRAEALGD
jgi:hypothetical protein